MSREIESLKDQLARQQAQMRTLEMELAETNAALWRCTRNSMTTLPNCARRRTSKAVFCPI